jgi:hypothetical protein
MCARGIDFAYVFVDFLLDFLAAQTFVSQCISMIPK